MKKLILYIAITFFAAASNAQPVRCSPGYQDASCSGVLLNAAQAAPICSADPGWKTVAPAVWQGSKYSPPSCSYQAPPSCPPGYDQSTAPSWNGSAWTGLSCTPSTPPPPPTCAAGQHASGQSCVSDGIGVSTIYVGHANPCDAPGGPLIIWHSDGTIWTGLAFQQSYYDDNGQLQTTPAVYTPDAQKRWMAPGGDASLYEVYFDSPIYQGSSNYPGSPYNSWMPATVDNLSVGLNMHSDGSGWVVTIKIRDKKTHTILSTSTADGGQDFQHQCSSG